MLTVEQPSKPAAMTPSLRASMALILALAFGAVSPSAVRAESSNQAQSAWSSILSRHLDSDGNWNYTALLAERELLDEVYASLALKSPNSDPKAYPSENDRLAYWINAYNIATVRGVLDHYPLESVIDVKKASFVSLFEGGGFFAAQKFRFGKERMSLYRLENKVIRKRFADPRYHFALNCASLGCPQLPIEAFDSERLDAQLERETIKFINSKRGHVIDHANEKILVSQIFEWYEKDFIAHLKSLGYKKPHISHYLKLYLSPDKAGEFDQALESYRIDYLPYNWSLNDQAQQ